MTLKQLTVNKDVTIRSRVSSHRIKKDRIIFYQGRGLFTGLPMDYSYRNNLYVWSMVCPLEKVLYGWSMVCPIEKVSLRVIHGVPHRESYSMGGPWRTT